MRVIIIGTGLAGQLVLRGLRQSGFEGEIVLFTEHSGDFYAKPSLSNVWTQGKCPDDLVVSSCDEVKKEFKCQVYQERIVKIDRKLKCVHTVDDQYTYDFLVLGLGAQWVDLPILPKHPNVFRVNHLDDYRKFFSSINNKTSVAIIGGGLIGVEFAYDIAKVAQHVVIIEQMPSLLGTMVPEEIGEYIAKGLSNRGVDVKVDTIVRSIKSKDRLSIELEDKNIEVDVILAAVGLRSELKLAKEAGLQVSEAIEVNEYGQSSDPSIYALGDCAKVCGLLKRYVAPMKICAQGVVDHIMGKDKPIVYPPLPVLLKTSEIPVCFCYSSFPATWNIKVNKSGIEALAYEGDTLVGFALAGDISQRMELKERLKPWLE